MGHQVYKSRVNPFRPCVYWHHLPENKVGMAVDHITAGIQCLFLSVRLP